MRLTDIANPRQTILVSCEAEAEIVGKKALKKNIMTLDWHMPLSFEPPMYAIAVGKARFSCGLIQKSRCFAVNFMPESMKKEVLFCGRNTGQFMDKFKASGLAEEECEEIHCPRIKEALAWLECEVVEEVETGDHITFIGKVVHMSVKKEGKRLFHKGKDDFTTTK